MTGPIHTVAIMAPGEMGQAVAAVLKHSGLRVITSLQGRSARTRALAEAAGGRGRGGRYAPGGRGGRPHARDPAPHPRQLLRLAEGAPPDRLTLLGLDPPGEGVGLGTRSSATGGTFWSATFGHAVAIGTGSTTTPYQGCGGCSLAIAEVDDVDAAAYRVRRQVLNRC